MKMLLVGRAGTRAFDWSGYALLRDNVQHFIEGGEPTERFAALHGIELAVDEGQCFVDAARLRGEVLRAWYALAGVPLERAAVSLRTRAILTESSEVPTARGTVGAKQVGWPLPVVSDESVRIAEAAKYFVIAVLSLTERAVDGEHVEVRRFGAPPRFAARTPDAEVERSSATMKRTTVMGLALKAVCVGLLAVGCSSGWTMPPKTPPDLETEQEARKNAEQRNDRDEREPVVAPPPAYGNKLVRRQAHATTRTGPAHH